MSHRRWPASYFDRLPTVLIVDTFASWKPLFPLVNTEDISKNETQLSSLINPAYTAKHYSLAYPQVTDDDAEYV